MSTYPRSQDTYIQIGNKNEYRVRGERKNWWVEQNDSNGVWVDAEPPGFRYPTRDVAIEAAKALAEASGGEVVD